MRQESLRDGVIQNGEVAEWSKAHAWKVCVLQKGTKGSNPFLSAKKMLIKFKPNSL